MNSRVKRRHIHRGWAAALATTAIAAAIMVPMLTMGGNSQPAAKVSHVPDQLADKEILDKALLEAEACHDPHPTSIRYVRSTRGPANTVMADAGIDPSARRTPVVLVVMTGHFMVDISHPAGVTPDPHARQIEMILDEGTGYGLDWGERPDVHQLDLSSLGTVHQLLSR